MLKIIFFDLDGTLLPMDMDEFTHGYFKLLVQKAMPLGYEPTALVQNIWGGTKAMAMNDGSKTNEDAFWEFFASIYGEDKLKDKAVFDDFYANEFKNARQFCGFNPAAAQIVDYIKSKGIKVVLATNPIFPEVATKHRMEWAGIKEEDFEFVTVYENSVYAKPNIKYYEDVLAKAGAIPEESLMVGNDAVEDLVAAKTGMKVFLVTDCLVNPDNIELEDIPHGGFDNLKKYIDSLI